jgi:opacity protein-like surface antigen
MNFKSALPILALGCLALHAGEPARLGIEGFVSNPAGSLRTTHGRTAGLGLGLFLDKSLGEGHGLRWDISSSAAYPGTAHTFVDPNDPGATKHTRTSRLFSYGTNLSYTYHFDGGQTGPYVLAGLGLRAMERSSKLTAMGEPGLTRSGLASSGDIVSKTGTKLAYRLGVGYDFTENLGANVRFQGMTSQGRTLATVEGGVTYRF